MFGVYPPHLSPWYSNKTLKKERSDSSLSVNVALFISMKWFLGVMGVFAWNGMFKMSMLYECVSVVHP